MGEVEDGMEMEAVREQRMIYGSEKVQTAIFITTDLKTLLEAMGAGLFLLHTMREMVVLQPGYAFLLRKMYQ